jgi:glucose uptake protein GlcU
MTTAAVVDKDLLNIVATSVLAAAVLVTIFAFREKRTGLRAVFGLVGLALVGWAIWLYAGTDNAKAKGAADCKRALSQLRGLAEGKLAAVGDKTEAQAVANQMIKVIDESSCKP